MYYDSGVLKSRHKTNGDYYEFHPSGNKRSKLTAESGHFHYYEDSKSNKELFKIRANGDVVEFVPGSYPSDSEPPRDVPESPKPPAESQEPPPSPREPSHSAEPPAEDPLPPEKAPELRRPELGNLASMWVNADVLKNLPTSGSEWAHVLDYANQSARDPNLSNQDDSTNVRVLAKALVYARTGEERYRTEVRQAVMKARETENGGRTLALGRELMAYIVAAGMVGLTQDEDQKFRRWLDRVRREMLSGRTLISTHEDRPNNWGTMAGASRIAAAIYLGDTEDLEKAVKVFRGYLGDRSQYNGFKFGDLSWQADPTKPVGINPKGATKNGINIDGVLPDDQRRGGNLRWPPRETGYVYEGLQGVLAQAVLLYQAGYTDVWDWSDQAILRAFRWLNEVVKWRPTGDDVWQPFIVDYFYGTNYSNGLEDKRPGKITGFAEWLFGTHDSKAAPPAAPSEPPVDLPKPPQSLEEPSQPSEPPVVRPQTGDLKATAPDLKVAFIGDQGLTNESKTVLRLIKEQGADLVIHSGDFDYSNNPAKWEEQINSILGANFPYFGSIGNHDTSKWDGPGGYQDLLEERLSRVSTKNPAVACTGDYGIKSSCIYEGLFFILSGVGTKGSGHDEYIRDALAQDDSIWSIASWHKNQHDMQVGGKGDECARESSDDPVRKIGTE